MGQEKIKIPPSLMRLVVIVLCAIGCGILISLGYTTGAGRSPGPVALLGLCIPAFLVGFRFTYVDKHEIKVRFCFGLQRRIANNRVSSVHFVKKDDERIVLFILDGCNSYNLTETNLDMFCFKHPFKVIRCVLPAKKWESYAQLISKNYSNITYIDWGQ